jgi:hypothetical protein
LSQLSATGAPSRREQRQRGCELLPVRTLRPRLDHRPAGRSARCDCPQESGIRRSSRGNPRSELDRPRFLSRIGCAVGKGPEAVEFHVAPGVSASDALEIVSSVVLADGREVATVSRALGTGHRGTSAHISETVDSFGASLGRKPDYPNAMTLHGRRCRRKSGERFEALVMARPVEGSGARAKTRAVDDGGGTGSRIRDQPNSDCHVTACSQRG